MDAWMSNPSLYTIHVLTTRCSWSSQMPAWFDIRGLGPTSAEDEDGIVKAALALNELVDKEIAAGIPPNRIVIGAF